MPETVEAVETVAEPSLNPSVNQADTTAQAKTSPWLHKYQWTPERARELQKKGMEVRLRNKAIREELRLNSVDPTSIVKEQIRIVKEKLSSTRTSASDRKILTGVLRDLFGMLPDYSPQVQAKPAKQGPVEPIV